MFIFFNKPEQFSIIIPLLEDYIPDFKYWGYYYKLKHWKVKRATPIKMENLLKIQKKKLRNYMRLIVYAKPSLKILKSQSN